MLEKILNDYHKLLEHISDQEDFLKTYETFIQELAIIENHAFEPVNEIIISRYSSFFTSCQRRYLMIKEQNAARSFINSTDIKNGLIKESFNSEFEISSYSRVEDLAQMVDFSSCKKIVMVGCGAFPATLFWIYDHYPGMEYIGIDIDSTSIALASSVSKILNLKKFILKLINGSEYNYSNVDFVYIANQVTPKNEVLRRVMETSNGKIPIVVRNPTPLGKLLAECVLKSSPSNVSFIQAGQASKSFLSQDLLIQRTNNAKNK
jgi:hypothetical protein